jgi:hypothetical protein
MTSVMTAMTVARFMQPGLTDLLLFDFDDMAAIPGAITGLIRLARARHRGGRQKQARQGDTGNRLGL